MPTAAKSNPIIIIKSYRWKHSGKTLKEIYWLKHHEQLSFKYFQKSFFILRLFSKVSLIQTTISRSLKHDWVKLVLADQCSLPAPPMVRASVCSVWVEKVVIISRTQVTWERSSMNRFLSREEVPCYHTCWSWKYLSHFLYSFFTVFNAVFYLSSGISANSTIRGLFSASQYDEALQIIFETYNYFSFKEDLSCLATCVTLCELHTHTHTHIYIYIYKYIYK